MNKHSHYQSTGVASEVFQATPHRLIQMLFEGALKNLFCAKGGYEASEFEAAEASINKASRIVSELQASLDFRYSTELSQNLYYVYDYIKTCLITSIAKKDAGKIDEAIALLKEIKAGWDGIPDDIRLMDEMQLRNQVA